MMNLQKETVTSCIDRCLKVIRMYDWLLDLYVLDFFVDNHWEKLPLIWREFLDKTDPKELGFILSGKSTKRIPPLSFLALINCIKVLTLPREGKYQVNHTRKYSDLTNLFLKHVKLKKRHEISLMAAVVNDTALKTSCEAVVDFGSGLGHLVRMLAYKYELSAVGIECQLQLTEEARKLDLEFEYSYKKHLPPEAISKLKHPTHINTTLTSHQQLAELPLTNQEYGLVGLHPCGNLGPLLIRHFLYNEQVKFICLVGCCYMKLSCKHSVLKPKFNKMNLECNQNDSLSLMDNDYVKEKNTVFESISESPNNSETELSQDLGYPLSEYVKGLDSKLSYVSREIACHAIEVYCERLVEGKYENLKVHAYRAALETLLVEHSPKLKHAPVRSIKHSDSMTFERYCTLATQKLNIKLDGDWSRGEALLEQWRRVVTVYTLRLTLASLVETVVLLDRVLFILEQGMSCEIHPVFDPNMSPRNHIMIARR